MPGRLENTTPQKAPVKSTVGRVSVVETKPKKTQAEIDAEIKRINDEKAKKDKEDGIKQGTAANYLPSLGRTIVDTGKGIAKGIGQTTEFASSVGEKVLQTPLKLAGFKLPEKSSATQLRETVEKKTGTKQGELFKPNTPGEKLGKGIEQAAEYVLPGGAGLKGAKAAKTAFGLGRLGALAAEGAIDAATSLPLLYSQRGAYEEPVSKTDVAVNTGISLSAPVVFKAVGKGLGRLTDFVNDNRKQVSKAALKTEQVVKNTIDDNALKLANNDQVIPKTIDNTTIKVNKPIQANKAEILADKSIPNGLKPSKFAQGVAESDITTPEVSKGLRENPPLYEVQGNKEVQQRAADRVKANTREAENFVLSTEEPSADHTATAVELIKKFQSEGDHDAAIRIADDVSQKLTKAGQAVQAAKLYENLSPESILIKAKRFITKENSKRTIFSKAQELTSEDATKLYDTAVKMKSAVGDAKDELANELASILSDYRYISTGKKISAAQAQLQLLNPKTLIRNVGGNELFYRMERLSKIVALPIDTALSKLTGTERTIVLNKGQGQFWQDFFKGAKAGAAGKKIANLDTQFDVPTKVFKSKWNPFYWGEKALGASLKSFDYAAYNRARLETLNEFGRLRAAGEGLKGDALKEATKKYANSASEAVLEIADKYGKYVTFQDDNLISKGAVGIKKGLNAGQDFGLGDLVLKYPKTPGALLSRAIEYSPAGFLQSAYKIGEQVLKGGGKSAELNRELALTTARAIIGTLGFTGLGYYFADKGFIQGRQSSDKDVNTLQKSVGQGKYTMNLSAITRWVKSGFKNTTTKPGDYIYTYDWAQPLAVSLSVGANMNGGVGKVGAGIGEQIASGASTITEQPLLSGLTRLFGYGDPIGGLKAIGEGAASSFTPTLANQFRQYLDNQTRSTNRSSSLQTSGNLVKNKVPGLANDLPPKYDTLGNPQQNFDSNNIFQVFFSPGSLTTFKENPETKLILDLISSTGETKQVPRVLPTQQTVFGQKIEVSPDDYASLQKYAGERTMQGLGTLLSQPAFNELSNDEKVSVIANNLTDISVGVKALLMAKQLMEMNAKGEDTTSLQDTLKPADIKNIQNAVDYLKANPDFFKLDKNPLKKK